RAYDALTGRWTGVDPKPNPAISTYAAMGCNPVRYMDPRGDTTYVYDKIGHFKDIVYGKLPTEIHFTDDIEGCSNDANSLEELIRKKSFAYLTRYQTKKIQKISTLSEKEQLERLFVLIKPHNSRELSVEDITTFLPKGARKGSGESQLGFGEIGEGFDDAVKTAKYVFYGNVFAVGHTHVRNAIKYALHDVQRPSYPNDEPQAGMNDFISVLPAPHLAIIAGHYGISFYTTGLEKRYVVNGEVLGSQSYTSSPAFSWDYFNYKLKNFQTFGRE
ncbi:MAG TPA: hypothetical protein PKH93_07730, partial [Chitinophagales bacterium]|nr:hypothetical protein [Chitinophagales bacterium]